MIRKSFRIGLWLGLLAGIAFALMKIFRPKPEPEVVLDLGTSGSALAPSPTRWPPLEAAVPTPDPIQIPDPDVDPVIASEEPGLVTIGDVEPLDEPDEPHVKPAPTPVSQPVEKKPAAKKPAAPKKAPAAQKAPAKKTLPPWVDPKGNVCPKTHPVKGKLSSMIFQAPGNFAYDRTNPDRCYESADAATKDGLRPAKR